MKKTKLLYILNVAQRVNNFSYSSMIAAKELGVDFHIAGSWNYSTDEDRIKDEQKYGIKIHNIDFVRSPLNPGNKKAYSQLKALVMEENFDIIHCNTPVGGLLGRLVGKKCKVKKVIYQVHGFHFYKGAPKKNWMIYYPIEKWLAKKTDALITINNEDYEFAKNKIKLRGNGKKYYIPGVGIDLDAYTMDSSIRSNKRRELGLSDDDIMLITSGNLDKNKNFETAIEAISKVGDKRIHLYICGQGEEMENLLSLVNEKKLCDSVHLLGYRSDMRELLCASDALIMTSFREGLSRSIMEGMACGLPCIVSKIRGNVDLIEDGKGGFLCDALNPDEFASAILKVAKLSEMRETMRIENLNKVKNFELSRVIDEMKKIYTEIFEIQAKNSGEKA